MRGRASFVRDRSASARDVNVTPMIDVVMCLIVFYLIVGHLVEEQRSEVDLPDAVSGVPDRPAQPLVINVIATEGGSRIMVDGRARGLDDLKLILKDQMSLRPGSVVQLRGDERLTYGSISRIVAACREAGAASMEIATEGVP